MFFKSVHEYLILLLKKIYIIYENITFWLSLPVGFSKKRYVSQEQEIVREKNIFEAII